MKAKKVIYLFGAGSSQGDVSFVDPSIFLLTSDVVDGIVEKIDTKNIKLLREVKNELRIKSDVEHLITLYENIGTAKHSKIAKKLKELFREEILERLKLLKERNQNFFPALSCALIDMHDILKNSEELSGIMTVNYDDLIEQAIHITNREINLSIKVNNKSNVYRTSLNGFPLLKLHGSFNWANDYPVTLSSEEILNSAQVLWIPPGIDKNRGAYPFNLLWAKAKEILECDILRIIGCSLNRNDMQLISLIFSMQKINSRKKLKIEIINFIDVGELIRENYPYLSIETITEIPECRQYLLEYSGITQTDEIPETLIDIVRTNPRTNIFEWWLRAKGNQLKKNRSIKSITTANNYFSNLINQA